MSLPSCFAAPGDAAHSIPLIAVTRDTLTSALAAYPTVAAGWASSQGFNGEPGSVLCVPDAGGGILVALVGIGDPEDPQSIAHAPFALPPGTYAMSLPKQPISRSNALLGWGLGAYRFKRYSTPPREPAKLVLGSDAAEQSEAFALLKASTLVRDLINTPAEHMGPEEMEAMIGRVANSYGGSMTCRRGDELIAQNFPAIHAVGRASHRAPRLIELRWGNPEHPRLSLVGKGVCFDSGGLDIKAAAGMRNMKKDMGGAAHAVGLAQLVMARKLPVSLQLLVPAVENSVGPNAFRPGDVLETRAGISVEIDNTDAEGRLVLCDALTYAGEFKPELLLDFATLTGAARIALGPDLPALFCNDEPLAADYLAAATKTCDPLWRMPLWRPYLSYLTSSIADIANSGGSRMAGSVTAALYLERFVSNEQRWAHVDVYSWSDSARPGRPAGGEAQGLRAAFALLKSRYSNPDT